MKIGLFGKLAKCSMHRRMATATRLLSTNNFDKLDNKQSVRPVGRDTGITVYDVTSKSKVPLLMENESHLKWYACGPTVYDDAHIGHACFFVRGDIIRRILSQIFNINVVYIMNLTDIDQKIVDRAAKDNQTTEQIANHYTDKVYENFKRLNILPAIICKVTDYIPAIIRFIQRLIDNGSAYATTQGNVYFRCSLDAGYGSRLHTGSNENALEKSLGDKEDAKDFVLWKACDPSETVWESPWSQGRPGWHIECSTIASEMFGNSVDIHSGGADLIFPHHENELAQCCSYHQKEHWVKYWIHTGLLRLADDTNKMSKSLGNVMTIDSLLERYTADQFRIFCLLSRYYTDVEFSDDIMKKSTKIHRKLTSLVSSAERYINNVDRGEALNATLLSRSLSLTQKTVREALADNFDTPKAMSAVMNLVHVCNIELNKREPNPYSQAGDSSRVDSVAACKSYIETIMSQLGVNVSVRQIEESSLHNSQQFSQVVDSVVSFRRRVREFSLGDSTIGVSAEEKRRIQNHRKSNAPLLNACDQIRHELSSLSQIDIQDAKDGRSYWKVAERKPRD